ncbi:hypothetical protein PW52_02815 [Tamlana sedimentorum]|uniref:Uncharacterized protein n=1 Tax=Neotamlana sedimentorum TaxID=1435349 RepID=A0A0D7WBN9_9FLAO|nr:hypothetical protein [Tamlana sedimentorum]KJD36595.1 hypothetical protein PW52_02815 [Tamlana sedimentorum]
MKKKLESELISIAHKILKLKGKEDVKKMHEQVALLYEKLSVLKFAEENAEAGMPSIGSNSSFFGMLDSAFNNKISDSIEVEDKVYIKLEDDEDNKDDIMEHAIHKIKDMATLMPDKVDEPKAKPDFDEITAGFQETPIFEPVTKVTSSFSVEKKSLNDKLNVNKLSIGLNDKIAFINQLFDGKSEDYDRVISQLNTTETFTEAQQFINTMIKPDYNNWQDKEEIEERFLEIIHAKFS